VWSAFGATVADVVHVHQRPLRFLLPVDPERLAETFKALEAEGRDVLRLEGFGDDRVELRRSLRMRYAKQVFDIEVPLAPGTPLQTDAVVAAFERTYEALHGADSGHPEGGIEIMSFIVRARGVTDSPALVAPGKAAEASWSSRPVHWYELGGFADTPVLRLAGGTVADRLEGPLLIELPDTVVVLRPGQTAHFGELGSLVVEI
jgi:N-methylhydantoinase A